MQVRNDEGVAIHIGPEPCVGIREGAGEASAGERIGQPLSRDRRFSREPTLYSERKATRTGAQTPWSETLACTDAPWTETGRSHV